MESRREAGSSLSLEAPEFEIRRTVVDDLPAVLAINQECGRSSASLEAMAESLVDPRRHWVVAAAEGEIVGWAKTLYWDHADARAPTSHYLGGVTVLPQ